MTANADGGRLEGAGGVAVDSCRQAEAPAAEAFAVLDCAFTVASPTREVADAVRLVYGEMAAAPPASDAVLPITVDPDPAEPSRWQVHFDGQLVFDAARLGDLLHQLDNHLTIALEHARPDLYFVHAAALADSSGVTLLVGESGAGKSTTTYALAAAGMGYLSDELAAIEPRSRRVLAYPRALCLKRDPPAPLRLPARHLRTEWTLHVRPRDLSGDVRREGAPLYRIFFVRWSAAHRQPQIRPLSGSEATLRLYQGALNQLAHPALGLDETLRLISGSECAELLTADVPATVDLVMGRGHGDR